MYRLWRDETWYRIWTQSTNPRQSYCDLSVWPYDLEHCITCCARLWDNFHQVWPLTTYPFLNYSIFYADTLCHAVTLTFDLMTLKVCSTSCVTWSKSSKFERNWAIPGWIIHNFANFCTRYITLWLWPLRVSCG